MVKGTSVGRGVGWTWVGHKPTFLKTANLSSCATLITATLNLAPGFWAYTVACCPWLTLLGNGVAIILGGIPLSLSWGRVRDLSHIPDWLYCHRQDNCMDSDTTGSCPYINTFYSFSGRLYPKRQRMICIYQEQFKITTLLNGKNFEKIRLEKKLQKIF